MLVVSLALVACKPPIHPEDPETKIVHDVESVCARIGAGELDSWSEQAYTSKTWQRLKARVSEGDAKAPCDAAKVSKQFAEQTRTCTNRVITAFKRHSCR